MRTEVEVRGEGKGWTGGDVKYKHKYGYEQEKCENALLVFVGGDFVGFAGEEGRPGDAALGSWHTAVSILVLVG